MYDTIHSLLNGGGDADAPHENIVRSDAGFQDVMRQREHSVSEGGRIGLYLMNRGINPAECVVPVQGDRRYRERDGCLP